MLRVSEKEYLAIVEFKLFFLLVIRMVNLLKYIEEKNGTFESPRYSRGLVIAELVIAEFHCITI